MSTASESLAPGPPAYTPVGWNRQKVLYDRTLAGLVIAYLGLFVGLGARLHPDATTETLLIRAFGTCALLMLHVVLVIGPLCRLDSRFLPLLYNRRHLGVATCLVGTVHAAFSLIQFHALGDENPLVSLFAGNTRFASLAQFPFQILGFGALVILLMLASTSHDFWLHALSPGLWKRLHMLVYLAYALLVAHVLLGALQTERSPFLAVTLGAGLLAVCALHVAAAQRETAVDQDQPITKGFVEVCAFDSIPEGRARVVAVQGERLAVFRHQGTVHALSNVCRHQNGPLGEGKIVNGCVTCPWHGYQYDPATGVSPPPYHDRVETYPAQVLDGKVLVRICRS
jgi:nitrite reductase/ring-hydroxylating ferredoxin subunit/DMSO/TMAO reductase YedYZ heme-binding membrane subunit